MAAGDPLRERHLGGGGVRRGPRHVRPRRLHRDPGGRQVRESPALNSDWLTGPG